MTYPSSPKLSFAESNRGTKPALTISTQTVIQDPEVETETKDYDPHIGALPSSPFYRHATPSSKFARLTSQRQRSRTFGVGKCTPIDDIEGQNPPWQKLYDDEARNTNPNSRTNIRELKLWAKKKRYFDCLAGLTKAQRLWVKIAIAVVILGCMVAVALGITKAVGGGVWSGEHQSETFG
ncbi:hypothetical protein BDV06DRAFT_112264 [Aspergillus oleicola]